MIHWLALFALIACGFALPAYVFARSTEAIVKHITKR